MAKNGQFAGLFQLGSSFGGEERYDPAWATARAIKYMRSNRKVIESKGHEWENWHAYMAHQQGSGGLSSILSSLKANPNALISGHKYAKNMLNNYPKSARPANPKIKDFVNYWRTRFSTETSQCSMKCASGVSGLSNGGSDDEDITAGSNVPPSMNSDGSFSIGNCNLAFNPGALSTDDGSGNGSGSGNGNNGITKKRNYFKKR